MGRQQGRTGSGRGDDDVQKRVRGLLALVAMILVGTAAVATAATPSAAKSAAPAPAAPEAKAAPAPLPPAENAGYMYCVREANDALTLARLVVTSGVSRQQAAAAAELPGYLRAMSDKLFDEREAGRAPTHVHFATTRFKACLKEQQVALDLPDERLFGCLSRADIPFYFMVMRQDNVKMEEAVGRLKTALAPWRHTDALIEALAEPTYTAAAEGDITSLQFLLINGCLLPPDQLAALYGAPAQLPALPAPAGAAPPAAPAAPAGTAPQAAPPAKRR